MTPKTTSTTLAAALAVLTSFLLLPMSASAGLVAAWEFNTGTAADYTSSVGGYTLTQVDGGAPSQSVGTISLDEFTGLYSNVFSNPVMTTLRTNATLYVRMKFDTYLGNDGFFVGLVNDTGPSDFQQQALTAFLYDGTTRATAGYGFTSIAPEATGFAPAGSLPAAGTFFTLALVIDQGLNAAGDVNPTDTRFTMNLNGVEAYSAANGPDGIIAFQTLAIGKVKNSGGLGGITIDSIRLYDESLTAAQIAAIPEPASMALSGFLLVGLAFNRRRRVLS